MNIRRDQIWSGKNGVFTVKILEVNDGYVIFKPIKIQGETIPEWVSPPAKLKLEIFLEQYEQ